MKRIDLIQDTIDNQDIDQLKIIMKSIYLDFDVISIEISGRIKQ